MTADEVRAELVALGTGLPPSPGTIGLELDGPVARLWIDNPGSRNAITLAMMVQLADAVARLEAWDGSVLVIAARGSTAFCSGGHLDEVRRAIPRGDAAARMCRAMTALLDRLLDLPVVSVSAIDGPAIGGGAELCTATDFRVAGARGRIHFVHAALGIVPGWGGAGRLVRHVGPRTALSVLASARPIQPEEALGLGLIDRRGASAEAEATALLGPIAALPPEAVRGVKRQVIAARSGDAEAAVGVFASLWGAPEHVARVHAVRPMES